jgi:hypothetical protein
MTSRDQNSISIRFPVIFMISQSCFIVACWYARIGIILKSGTYSRLLEWTVCPSFIGLVKTPPLTSRATVMKYFFHFRISVENVKSAPESKAQKRRNTIIEVWQVRCLYFIGPLVSWLAVITSWAACSAPVFYESLLRSIYTRLEISGIGSQFAT